MTKKVKPETSDPSNVHHGSSFDDFLEEQGLHNEVESAAIKKVLAWQFLTAMKKQKKSKQGMASELCTSRTQLDRLLDPENTAVSLETMSRAANALGKHLVIEIRDEKPRRAITSVKSVRIA